MKLRQLDIDLISEGRRLRGRDGFWYEVQYGFKHTPMIEVRMVKPWSRERREVPPEFFRHVPVWSLDVAEFFCNNGKFYMVALKDEGFDDDELVAYRVHTQDDGTVWWIDPDSTFRSTLDERDTRMVTQVAR